MIKIMTSAMDSGQTEGVIPLMRPRALATRMSRLIRHPCAQHPRLTGLVALVGVIVYAIGRFALPASRPANTLVILAGFLLVFGAGIFWWKSRIRKNPDEYRQSALWTSWWAAIAGGIIVAAGIIIEVSRPTSGAALSGFGFFILLLVAPCMYLLVSRIPVLRVQGVTRMLAIATLLGCFILCFPATIILLVTDEPPVDWIGPQTSSPIEGLLIFSVPFLLVLVPLELAYSQSWNSASNEIRGSLPPLLANLATATTCLYVITLHYLSGPLKGTSISKLAVAILSVVVLLRPFYKAIAEQCWRLGPIDTLTLSEWRKTQWSTLCETFQVFFREGTAHDSAGKQTGAETAQGSGPSTIAGPDDRTS
jgi:hypothetical protein